MTPVKRLLPHIPLNPSENRRFLIFNDELREERALCTIDHLEPPADEGNLSHCRIRREDAPFLRLNLATHPVHPLRFDNGTSGDEAFLNEVMEDFPSLIPAPHAKIHTHGHVRAAFIGRPAR